MKLKAAQLKALPDDQFGLPASRKYPMPDKAHVIKAVQFFGYAKPEERKELAKNINRRAKELGVKMNPHGEFRKYASSDIVNLEASNVGTLEPIVAGTEPVLTGIRIPGMKDDVPMEDKFLGAFASDELTVEFEALDAREVTSYGEWKDNSTEDSCFLHNWEGEKEVTPEDIDRKFSTFAGFDKYVRDCIAYKEHEDMRTYMTTPILYSYFDRLKWAHGSGCDTIDHVLSYMPSEDGHIEILQRPLSDEETKYKMDQLYPIYSDPTITKAERIAYFARILNNSRINKTWAIKHIMDCIKTRKYASPIDILFAHDVEPPNYKLESPDVVGIDDIMIHKLEDASEVINLRKSFFGTTLATILSDKLHCAYAHRWISTREEALFWANWLNKFKYAIISPREKYSEWNIFVEDGSRTKLVLLYRDTEHPENVCVVMIPILNEKVEEAINKINSTDTFANQSRYKELMERFVDDPDMCQYKVMKLAKDYKPTQEASFVNGRRIIDAMKGMKIKDNGDITLDMQDKLSFEHYNQVHKVVMMNIKENNINGMKENAAYIFAIISRIENDYTFNRMMNKTSKQYREMIRLRALYINDFKMLVEKIMKVEKDFRFMDYYKETGYDDSIHTIDHRVIKSLGLVFAKIMAV